MKQKQKPKTKADYEKLGKMLQSIYESGYIDRNQLYKMSFLKGLFTGLGGVIGATVLLAALLWILSVLNYTPLKPINEWFRETVQVQQ